jgi:hypothetical protein
VLELISATLPYLVLTKVTTLLREVGNASSRYNIGEKGMRIVWINK